MANRNKNDNSSRLTIIEAVETLSSIADLDPDRDIGVGQKHEFLIQGQPVTYHTIHWLHEDDADATIKVIKDTFKVVLRYLRGFYRKEYGYLTDTQTLEGIKTIMVLVGEAAKKLDKFTKIFYGANTQSVTHLREYRQLQEFYQTRIAKKIDEGTLGKWVLALTGKVSEESPSIELRGKVGIGGHTVIDLDAVKRDSEYELFFLRKEDGSRFFSPRLLRNIRLVCDFGEYFGDYKGDDPLAPVGHWHDWILQNTAHGVLKSASSYVDTFFRRYSMNKSHELVALLNYTLMSLMLSANPQNLKRNKPVKSCTGYFRDFQVFLRQVLTSREYQKLITYPPRKTNKMGWCMLYTVHALCEALYVRAGAYTEMTPVIGEMIEKARQVQTVELEEVYNPSAWWDVLSNDYSAMMDLLKRHPNGSMHKVLEMLKEDKHQYFDPIVQQNIPCLWFNMHVDDWIVSHTRMPTPTRQDFVNKAKVNNELKGLLRSYAQSDLPRRHLIINLQDRTSWLEHPRCDVLEHLQHKGDFKQTLRVVTLACNTDFYNQLAPYHEMNEAKLFLSQFCEHMADSSSGYLFPSAVKDQLFPKFVPRLLRSIHKMFFGERNVVTRRERLAFIQLTHLFLTLKMMDLVQPESFSFVCKDGVDTGAALSGLLYACIRIFNNESMSQHDLDYLYLMLFAPSLLVRERVMLPERFQRVVGSIKRVGLVRDEMGFDEFTQELDKHFGPLFDTPLLRAHLAPPAPRQLVW